MSFFNGFSAAGQESSCMASVWIPLSSASILSNVLNEPNLQDISSSSRKPCGQIIFVLIPWMKILLIDGVEEMTNKTSSKVKSRSFKTYITEYVFYDKK